MAEKNKGMVLISTIIVLSVIVPVVLYISYSAKMDVRYAVSYKDKKELLYSFRGIATGIILGLRGLPLSSMVGKRICKDGVCMYLYSDDGLLNINAMLLPDNRTADAFWVFVFKRLSDLLRVPDYTASILDYIDEDSIQRANGSEVDVPNRRMISKKELLLVKGMKRTYFKRLSPFLTVCSTGRVNPNYAPPLLLLSLDDRLTDDIVRKIVDVRKKRRIGSLKELLELGVPASVLYDLKEHLTFRSIYFTMYISLKKDGVLGNGIVTFKKGRKAVELLYVNFQ